MKRTSYGGVILLVTVTMLRGLARVQPFGPNGGGGPVAATAQVATQTACGLAECIDAQTHAGTT